MTFPCKVGRLLGRLIKRVKPKPEPSDERKRPLTKEEVTSILASMDGEDAMQSVVYADLYRLMLSKQGSF